MSETNAELQGSKLEIESVVREVCDRIIYDSSLDKETVLKRVAALGSSVNVLIFLR